MSDEIFDNEDEIVGAEETQPGGKKVGFLPGIVIQILKWAAIIIGAVIFIVTVVVITMNILNRGNQPQSQLSNVEEYEAKPPIWAWYEAIGEIRGSTADEVRHTFIIEPRLGYDTEDRALNTELGKRTAYLRDMIRSYFSGKKAEELLGKENEMRVKEELKTDINRILINGKIHAVIFDSYQVVPF
jgi:flagellar FliL protein